MLATDSDFRLYDSNALDLLAQLLAAELARPAAGQSPLEPELILIPQVAMRRWLQATLAEQYGIAANLEFLTPGEFVARALKAKLPSVSGGDAMQVWTWIDGQWLEGNPGIVGPMTHALWLGSCVFDGARSFEGVAPDLDLHCARVVRLSRAA